MVRPVAVAASDYLHIGRTVGTTDKMETTLFYGTLVHTPKLGELQVRPHTLVAVQNGIITFVKHCAKDPLDTFVTASGVHRDAVRLVDASKGSKFLVPGFVDTHIHALQYPNVGLGLELPLLDWLTNVTFDMESKFTGADKKRVASEVYSKVIARTLGNGTTTALYFATIDTDTTIQFADMLAEAGQRGFVGKVCMDCNPNYPLYSESYEEAVAGTQRLIDHCKQLNAQIAPDTTMVLAVVTPRFAPLCLRELLKRLGEFEGVPVQTHLSENRDEIRLVLNLFPESTSYAGVYEQYGLLGKRTILAHCIHLTPLERELLRDRRCSISHCPLSNTFITSGEAPVRTYLSDGINVALGTDISGGCEQLILGAARGLIMVSHHRAMDFRDETRLSVAEALYMATVGGAVAVGMGSEIGTFALGMRFDAQLVDLDAAGNVDVFDFQKPQVGDSEDVIVEKVTKLVHRWVFSGDDRNCVRVWCNGRSVVDKQRAE